MKSRNSIIRRKRKMQKRRKIFKQISLYLTFVLFVILFPCLIVLGFYKNANSFLNAAHASQNCPKTEQARYNENNKKSKPDLSKSKKSTKYKASINKDTNKNITDVSGETETKSKNEKYFNVPLSHDLQKYIFKVAEKYGLPAELIIAVIQHESNFDPSVRSETSDSGLMQINDINLEELREKLNITDINDPYQNILAGAYILARCMNQGDEINPALMCYNMGYKNARELWNKGIWSSEYSRTVYDYYLKLCE